MNLSINTDAANFVSTATNVTIIENSLSITNLSLRLVQSVEGADKNYGKLEF